jgi:hypothetical protein
MCIPVWYELPSRIVICSSRVNAAGSFMLETTICRER